MATGVSWADHAAKCNGSKATLADPALHYDHDMHLKMSKKIAQLTKIHVQIKMAEGSGGSRQLYVSSGIKILQVFEKLQMAAYQQASGSHTEVVREPHATACYPRAAGGVISRVGDVDTAYSSGRASIVPGHPSSQSTCSDTGTIREEVIYALNTKSDEHEASLQAIKEAHQEEIQRIIAETRSKILLYKSRVGEEMDLRHQIQSLEDILEKHKKSKEEVLAQFEVYKQQAAEREKNMEREHAERIVALSREMLNIKKEFESNLQHFMEIQRRLEHDKQSFKLEEKHKMDIQCLNQELEVLKSEKMRLTTEFEKKVSKLQVSHQKELETLKKALQQSVTETLKQWQTGQKKSLQAQEVALQLKLKKLESDMEIKDQMMHESKSQCQKLQELLNTAELKIQDLENQLQKADNKLATSSENLQKMEDEAQLLREKLLEQKAEILHKTDENKDLSQSKLSALAELDDLKNQVSELQQQITVWDQQQQGNKDVEAEHSQQLTQVIEALTREKEEHHKRHEEELKKLKRVAEEEKLRLKEQLMKGLEELVKKHTTEIKAVQTSMELERKRLQKELQNQLDEINIKVENERHLLEKEKEVLYNRLQDSLQQISRMENLMKQRDKGIEQPDRDCTHLQASHESLLKDREQAFNQISELQEKLKKQKEQHEALVSSLQKEHLQQTQQLEVKWKEKVRCDSEKLQERLKREHVSDKQSALAHLQQEKEHEMETLQKKWKETTGTLEAELACAKKNLEQQINASQAAVQLLQSQLNEEKETLLQNVQYVTSLNQDLKSQLETLKQQALKSEERSKQQEDNYQNQLKTLTEAVLTSQREISELQKERTLLQDNVEWLNKELELKNQEAMQQRIKEEHHKSLEEELKAEHEKEVNLLKQNHLKEIQGIVSDFSSSQTRLQAKIVSLETELKEIEEKSQKHESKPEDLHLINKLQDKLSESDQVTKRLLDDRRFRQIALANSESNINRSFARSPIPGSFTPTMKKKRTEDMPVRVVSVPNLSSYEKSFLSSESSSINKFPAMTKSPSLDQNLNSTSRIFLQPLQVQPSKPAPRDSSETVLTLLKNVQKNEAQNDYCSSHVGASQELLGNRYLQYTANVTK
ncbi:protein FAM184B-like [Pristis pectinata]|uniref:protein FAM184B-like n=1 Tax=Pristis pectinata TaxID=685728 RepID=UPI00223E819C|nr:protein FAM184B-like [Pristis pectinata]